MKVINEPEWQSQISEIKGYGEVGESFLEWFSAWADATEREYEKSGVELVSCLRDTFTDTKRERGPIPVFMLGQMLVLFSAHWVYRNEFADQLSSIEMELLLLMLKNKIADLQDFAALEIEENDESGS